MVEWVGRPIFEVLSTDKGRIYCIKSGEAVWKWRCLIARLIFEESWSSDLSNLPKRIRRSSFKNTHLASPALLYERALQIKIPKEDAAELFKEELDTLSVSAWEKAIVKIIIDKHAAK